MFHCNLKLWVGEPDPVLTLDFCFRTKWKRQAASGLDLLAAAGRLLLPPHFLCPLTPVAPPTMDPHLHGGHNHRPLVLRRFQNLTRSLKPDRAAWTP